MAEVVFAIPGDADTPTGGYRYDRRVIDELRALRWDVKPLRLPGDFPAPSQASLQETERLFAAVPKDTLLWSTASHSAPCPPPCSTGCHANTSRWCIIRSGSRPGSRASAPNPSFKRSVQRWHVRGT